MFFLQSVQAPFMMGLLGKDNTPEYFIEIPKWTLEDAIAWGVVLSDRFRENQTAGMTDVQRHNFTVMNAPYPLTPTDLKLAAQSMEGAKEIISTTMPKGRIFKARKVSGKVTREKDRKFRDVEWVKGDDVTTPELLKSLMGTVLEKNGSTRLSQIAFEIADLYDLAPRPPKGTEDVKDDEEKDQDKEEGADPLKGGGQSA